MPHLIARFLVIAVFLFPAYVHAQPYTSLKTSDNEAQRLKASFQELLDYQKNVTGMLGGVELTFDGELTVSRQEDYYTLTFPHIYLSGFENKNPEINQVLDVGVITLNAMADEKPGYWKIVMTFPEEMTLYNADLGKEDPKVFSLTIGQQRSIAYYSEELGYFTKTDINLSDLGFAIGNIKTGINIGGIQFYINLEEQDEADNFSGPGHMLISGIDVSPPNTTASISMEELKLSFYLGNFALPTLKEYQQKLLRHKETFQSLQTESEDTPEVSTQNIFNMLADFYDFDMNSFSFAYSVKNIDIKNPDGESKLDSVHIDNGRLGAGITGLKTDEGALRLDWSYDGFKTTPEDPEIGDIIPQKLNTSLEAQNIPYNTLTKLAGNTFQSITQNPGAAQTAAFGVLMRLPAIISQAGTQIIIEKNNAKNHIYDITLDGKITTDLSSMIGFAVKFNLLFDGLDAFLDTAKKHSANEESDKANEYKNMATGLEKLKSIGKKTTGTAYSFDIELNQQGQPTINGVRTSTIFEKEEKQN